MISASKFASFPWRFCREELEEGIQIEVKD
jgi:hypothetical protein